MAVGTYTLPICDGCNLPWLPVGWTQDSDPRNLPGGSKPLRCGKCKSAGWDKLHNAAARKEATETAVSPFDPTKTIELPRNVALNEALDRGFTPASNEDRKIIKDLMEEVEEHNGSRTPPKPRCRHRMTDCPLCKPQEAA